VKFLYKWNTSIDANLSIYKKNIHDYLNYSNAKIVSCSFPHELISHNTSVWVYFSKVAILRNYKYWNSANNQLIRKLISLNTKKGNKFKAVKLFNNVLHYINAFFINFNVSLHKEHPAYMTFWNFSKNFPTEFYAPDFMFRYIYLYTELIFLIKTIKPKSKKKRKKKIQLKSMVCYLNRSSRRNVTIRLINAYINSSGVHNNVARLGDSIMYLIFLGKNSFLYKKKISMYQKILEKKKFY